MNSNSKILNKRRRGRKKIEVDFEKKLGRRFDTGRVPDKLENVCSLMARPVCPGN